MQEGRLESLSYIPFDGFTLNTYDSSHNQNNLEKRRNVASNSRKIRNPIV